MRHAQRRAFSSPDFSLPAALLGRCAAAGMRQLRYDSEAGSECVRRDTRRAAQPAPPRKRDAARNMRVISRCRFFARFRPPMIDTLTPITVFHAIVFLDILPSGIIFTPRHAAPFIFSPMAFSTPTMPDGSPIFDELAAADEASYCCHFRAARTRDKARSPQLLFASAGLQRAWRACARNRGATMQDSGAPF